MVEEITSIDFPSLPKDSEEKYDEPTIDPDHSWTGYHRWESALFYCPLFYVWRQYLEYYGWYLLGALITTLYLYNKLHPVYYRWKRAREDAEYYKGKREERVRLERSQFSERLEKGKGSVWKKQNIDSNRSRPASSGGSLHEPNYV